MSIKNLNPEVGRPYGGVAEKILPTISLTDVDFAKAGDATDENGSDDGQKYGEELEGQTKNEKKR